MLVKAWALKEKPGVSGCRREDPPGPMAPDSASQVRTRFHQTHPQPSCTSHSPTSCPAAQVGAQDSSCPPAPPNAVTMQLVPPLESSPGSVTTFAPSSGFIITHSH